MRYVMRLGTYYRYLVNKKLDLPLSGRKLLDVGCYDGFLLSHINAMEKVGIDINIIRKFPDVKYIEDNFMEYDFQNQRFDKIFAFDVIEHVREDKIFLEKIVQLLDSNGMAFLSTPSDTIKIFPSSLQPMVEKKWQHFYRRGYNLKNIENLSKDIDKNISVKIIYWNCPFFRFLYLPLSFIWRVCPFFAKSIVKHIVNLDSRFQDGKNGYLYIVITNIK